MDRKHRATGRKLGGARPGAGRPRGSAPLEYGEVAAVRALGLRVPEGAPQEHKDVADEAFHTLVKIMRGEIRGPDASNRRNTAKDIREEVCGPIAKQVNLADAEGNKLRVSVNIDLGGGDE